MVFFLVSTGNPGTTAAHPDQAPQLESTGSVSWFVQLSDLHVSTYSHPEIVPDLLAFGSQVLSTVRPQVLLVTGDLVDAKTRAEGSQQHPEEWQVWFRV